MRILNDIGNAISRMATDVANVAVFIINAIVAVIVDASETLAGLFRRPAW